MKPHSHDIGVARAFDCFCKKVLRNETRDYQDELARKRNREIYFSELPVDALEQLSVCDTYFADSRTFDVLGNSVCVDNETLAEAMKTGEWAREQYFARSYLLSGKTVGLVGIGNIAKKVAAILRNGFGCEILYYDVFRLPEETEREMGVRYVSLDELMAASDIVSIHVPLLESTAGMIDGAKLALMKPTAIIINTSRGGVIREPDLIEALESGKLLGAGLDTYSHEPLESSSPLLRMEQVVTTPHCAGNTVDNDINMAAICMECIEQYDRTQDRTMRTIVNKEYLV